MTPKMFRCLIMHLERQKERSMLNNCYLAGLIIESQNGYERQIVLDDLRKKKGTIRDRLSSLYEDILSYDNIQEEKFNKES